MLENCPPNLSSFFTIPYILRDHVNEGDAESEWRAHVNFSDYNFNVSWDLEYQGFRILLEPSVCL